MDVIVLFQESQHHLTGISHQEQVSYFILFPTSESILCHKLPDWISSFELAADAGPYQISLPNTYNLRKRKHTRKVGKAKRKPNASRIASKSILPNYFLSDKWTFYIANFRREKLLFASHLTLSVELPDANFRFSLSQLFLPSEL